MLDQLVETIQNLIKTPRSAGAERCSETAYRLTTREELTVALPHAEFATTVPYPLLSAAGLEKDSALRSE
jgi:hypothetical protein